MPKKTTRTAKSSQQKAREEQWRRRVTAQGLTTVDDFTDVSPANDIDENTDEGSAPVPSAHTMTAARPRQGSPVAAGRASSAAAQQRRTPASAATRASRLRPAATSLSMEEEMYYVRSDIRRLIILTAICLAVLIALSFLIR